MMVIYAVIVLGVLIFVHEFGHFLVAKLFNVKIEKFSLGFGPKAGRQEDRRDGISGFGLPVRRLRKDVRRGGLHRGGRVPSPRFG